MAALAATVAFPGASGRTPAVLPFLQAGIASSLAGEPTAILRLDPTPQQAAELLRRATEAWCNLAVHGGWTGVHGPEQRPPLGDSAGMPAVPTQIEVQPAGTSTVGELLLEAHAVTGDAWYIERAREAGLALAWGQRTNGGWDQRVDIGHFRADAPTAIERCQGFATFDDNVSQGALTFLIHLDKALPEDEPWLTETIQLGLDYLRSAQFEDGGWPQWYPLRGGYHDHRTFTDGAINDCIRVLLVAHTAYGASQYVSRARRGGAYIVRSQLAPPQAGWAQQYDAEGVPTWGRPSEPPAVCSAVTARNIHSLIDLFLATSDNRLLQPIGDAVDWLERSQLPSGEWALFYEIGSNRPIYADADGRLHYDLAEMGEKRRCGSSWHGRYGIPEAIDRYRAVRDAGPTTYAAERPGSRPVPTDAVQVVAALRRMEAEIRTIERDLNAEHRWADAEGHYRLSTFVNNARQICRYLALARALEADDEERRPGEATAGHPSR